MPRVSIVLPTYEAQATLERCLDHLDSQSYRDREIIVVDSSLGLECAGIVSGRTPQVHLIRSEARLLPHQALNLGVRSAQGELLAFIDPDAYPRADWLLRLVEAYDARGGAIVGGVACHGSRWIDLGAHLCKFDKWLPFESSRPLNEGPTVNFLMPRELFERHGPFPAVHWHGDTELSWRMREAGVTIRLEPAAIVEHHHLHNWRTLLAERFGRGRGFAELRLTRTSPSWPTVLWLGATSLLPVRLVSQLLRVWRNARAAGMSWAFVLAFPVLSSGLYAWLLGECATYARGLLRRRAAAR